MRTSMAPFAGRSCLPLWLLAAPALFSQTPPRAAEVASGEERWNPPLEGAYLGVRGSVRGGRFIINDVTPGTAADRAGLRSADAIIGIGGFRNFESLEDFRRRVESLAPGAAAGAVVDRGGDRIEVSVVPDHRGFRELSAMLERIRASRFLRRSAAYSDALAGIAGEDAESLRRASRWSDAYEILNRAAGRLGMSHTAVIPPWTYRNQFRSESGEAEGYSLGFLLVLLADEGASGGSGGRFFAIEVLDGGPASRAGLRPGDEVVRAGGTPVAQSPRRTLAGYESIHPFFVLQVDPGEEIVLEIRRRRDGPIERLQLAADAPIDGLRATRSSLRQIERGGREIAAVHLWNLLSPHLPGLLREHLSSGAGAGAEALLIDLRGRGGRVDVMRDLERLLRQDARPKVLLIDRNTRSAKELLARRLQGGQRTLLVGERTAGAVLPATFATLPEGSVLMLPGDPALIGRILGEPLEGIGVQPDIEAQAAIAYSGGSDPILERGLGALLDLLSGTPRRRRF